MGYSKKTEEVLDQIRGEGTLMGDLKRIAATIKKDHEMAMELWSTGEYNSRLLAVLIMDRKLITQDFVESLADDLMENVEDERNQVADWLLANQLFKTKRTMNMMETWENHSLPVLRRTFWNYQGRLRWTGKKPPGNTEDLLKSIEENLSGEVPEVQWAMNFCAAQIGIFDVDYRQQLIVFGENLGLYKDEPVSRGCTPRYLPEWIRIEAEKNGL